MDITGVEVFRTGRWNDVKTFTEADLDAMVASFTELALTGRVPLKLGHNGDQPFTDGQPALGWVSRVYREGDKLLADFTSMPRAVYDAVKAGLYKFVSVELLRDVIARGAEFPWVLSAVALLGADIPAVSGLKDLQALAMARRAEFRSGARLTFTRDVSTTGVKNDMTDETETLRAEVARLNRELVGREFRAAIHEGRILPRDQRAFEVRMGKDATLDEARTWISGTPHAPAVNRPRVPGGASSHDSSTVPHDERPDAELVRLAFAEVEKSGGKLTFIDASQKVMKANPELADRYRYQPGVKEY